MKIDKVIIADNQDLTAIAVETLLKEISGTDGGHKGNVTISHARCKKELLKEIKKGSSIAVIVDFSLFDFDTHENFTLLCECYDSVIWLILSEELTGDFLRSVLYGTSNVGVAYKDANRETLTEALQHTLNGDRYISQQAMHRLLEYEHSVESKDKVLTETEREILKFIAHGKTTKEIAAERQCSINTINAHRRNIFSKLGVNCAYSAMKYAFRSGLVDNDFAI